VEQLIDHGRGLAIIQLGMTPPQDEHARSTAGSLLSNAKLHSLSAVQPAGASQLLITFAACTVYICIVCTYIIMPAQTTNQ
jgi:hypothetical protein